jgi:hypothetical protein
VEGNALINLLVPEMLGCITAGLLSDARWHGVSWLAG